MAMLVRLCRRALPWESMKATRVRDPPLRSPFMAASPPRMSSGTAATMSAVAGAPAFAPAVLLAVAGSAMAKA